MTWIALIYFVSVTAYSVYVATRHNKLDGVIGIAVGVFGLVGTVMLIMTRVDP